LYTKEQFSTLNKKMLKIQNIQDSDSEEKSESSFENETARYVLHLTEISYAENEPIILHQKVLPVEYSASPNSIASHESFLMVRTDSQNEMGIIVLNSAHKYYCQLFLFSSAANFSANLRPISFISANDILPTDKYGRTSMLISDVVWTPNDLFSIISFNANYYCVLSRLGQTLNILSAAICPNPIHFAVLDTSHSEKIEDGTYPNLFSTDKEIFFIGNNFSTVVAYNTKITKLDLWKTDTNTLKVNKILRLLIGFENLQVNQSALDILDKALDKEVVYFSPQKRSSHDSSKKDQPSDTNSELIHFKNPFPVEPTVEISQVVACGLSLIEALRWSNNISNNLLELVQDEIENLYRLLYVKNEPMYFLTVIQLYKNFIKRQVTTNILDKIQIFPRNNKFNKALKKAYKSSSLFNSDKKKALFVFYCLIQFRNFKATSFNILYLVAAGLLKNKLNNHNIFDETLKNIMMTLRANQLSEKGKKHDFFETEIRTQLSEKGPIYKSMLEFCEKNFSETSTSGPENLSSDKEPGPINGDNEEEEEKNPVLEKSKQHATLLDLLMNLFEADKFEKMFKLISIIIKETGFLDNEIQALSSTKESYIENLWSCIALLRKGKYAAALKITHDLISQAISPEVLLKNNKNIFERPLILIIVYESLLLISMTILKHSKKTLDITEIHTFLYKTLTNDSQDIILQTFNNLLTPMSKMRESEKEILSDEKLKEKKYYEYYNSVCILMQISAHQIAINLLTENICREKSSSILLGILIANNQLNVNLMKNKDQTYHDYSMIIKNIIKRIESKYIEIVLKNDKKNKESKDIFLNIFSISIGLSSKFTGTIIVNEILPNFIIHLRNLFSSVDILPDQLLSHSMQKSLKSENMMLCSFIIKLSKSFCGCSPEILNRIFSLYLPDKQKSNLFNILLQESFQIFTAAIKIHLFDFLATGAQKADFIHVEKSYEPLKQIFIKLLQFIWEISLLISIESVKENATMNCLNRLKMAGNLMRFSALGASEQQELEYIQQGISLLKGANFSELKIVQQIDIELLQELGNAFDIYTEKWEGIIKSDKTLILSNLKLANPGAYKILSSQLAKRKPTVRAHTSQKSTISLESDLLFLRLLNSIKQIAIQTLQKEGEFNIELENCDELRTNLRKNMENIDAVTGIPKTMSLERENSKLILKTINPFLKDLDIIEDIKYQGFIEEILETKEKQKLVEYFVEDIDKYQYAIAGNNIGSWRVGVKMQKFNIFKNLNNNFLYPRIPFNGIF